MRIWPTYVLMTAAHNEEAFIEKTIASVLAQTVLPERWVIVSDGSTDRTDDIIQKYADAYPVISFIRVNRPAGRNFGSKGLALERAVRFLHALRYDFIGNVDADVFFEPTYFEELLKAFERDPQLGLAAGFIHEEQEGEFRNRPANRTDSVPHAGQLVRRQCYEVIGGYRVFKYGGEDWYAQQCAKMQGWYAEAFPELKIFHARHTGAGGNILRHQFRLGRLDYSFGSGLTFQFVKCALRITERPFLVGALARFWGYVWSGLRRESRPVSDEFIGFLRSEQRGKLRSILGSDGRKRFGQPDGVDRVTNSVR